MLDNYHASVRSVADLNRVLEAALYHHRVPDPEGSPEGAPYSFSDFPFMIEPLVAVLQQRDLVVSKCVQVGWTEMFICLMLMLSGVLGRRVVYCLPNDKLSRNFIQGRFNDTIERSPHYKATAAGGWRSQKAANLGLRHYGAGILRFIGARSRGNFKDYTADTFIIDEFDDLDLDGRRNVPLAEDRIIRSHHPRMVRAGNPTIAGAGIDELYQRSDQRRWHHTCGACGLLQHIDWFGAVVERIAGGTYRVRDTARAVSLRGKGPEAVTSPAMDIRPVCRGCEAPFARHHACRWVAASPGVLRRGYNMSQMDVPSVTLWSMWLVFQEALTDPRRLRRFYSGMLGQPFAREGSRLTDEDLRAARGTHALDHDGGPEYEKLLVVAGIDVGLLMNVVVSVVEAVPLDAEEPDGETRQVRRRVFAAAVKWGALDDILERYHVDRAVIDWGPELEKTREFAERHNLETHQRVWRCRFHTTPKTSLERWAFELDHTEEIVKADRTAILDQTFTDLRNGSMVLPSDILQVQSFADQMKAPVRQLNTKRTRYIWDEDGRPDHYRLADVYERLALEVHTVAGGGYMEVDLDDWG